MSSFSTGKYALAISDRSGMAFPYKEMVREWNGSLVHISEFESKHPQLEPRSHRGDAQSLRNARPARTEPPVAQLIQGDGMQTGATDQELIKITLPGHGFSTGDRVRFRGAVSHFPTYPQVSHVEDDDINAAAGHIVTKIDHQYFSFNPNDIITEWLTENCIPGTTTVYVDMDGVLTEYYQAVATFASNNGLLPPGGDWYDLTPAIELQAIAAAGGGGYFSNLGKRTEADALVDLVISKNGSWAVLSTGPTYNTEKTAWINARYTGARAPVSMDFATNFDKGPFGGANKLLIDDRTTFIDQFEAAGGKGFKYYESGGIKDFGGENMSVGPITILP